MFIVYAPAFLYLFFCLQGLFFLIFSSAYEFSFVYWKYGVLDVFVCVSIYLFFSAAFFISAYRFNSSQKVNLGFNFDINAVLLRYQYVIYFFVFLLLVLFVFSYGVYHIFSRPEYLPSDKNVFSNVLLLLISATPFLLGMMPRNLIGILLFIGCLVLVFSTSSRVVSLIPILYFFGGFIVSKKFSMLKFFSCLVFSVFILALALANRYEIQHGLIYYITNIFNVDYRFWIGEVFKNFASVFIVTLETLAESEGKFGIDYLLLSLNPKTGNALGWYSLYQDHMLTPSVPYSGIAELFRVNIVALCLSGVLLSVYYNNLLKLFLIRSVFVKLLALISVIVFTYSVLILLQYPLRNGFRMLQYSFFIYVLAVLFRRLRRGE